MKSKMIHNFVRDEPSSNIYHGTIGPVWYICGAVAGYNCSAIDFMFRRLTRIMQNIHFTAMSEFILELKETKHAEDNK